MNITQDKIPKKELRINPPKKPLGFNLLPSKTIQELEVIEERDNTFIYSFILVFGGVFVYFVLTFVDTILVMSRINNLNDQIVSLDKFIEARGEIRSTYGELISKGNLIKTALEKSQASPSEFLDIAAVISDGEPIIQYRQDNNSANAYSITLEVENYQRLTQILQKAKSTPEVKNVFISSIEIQEVTDSEKKMISVELIFEISKA